MTLMDLSAPFLFRGGGRYYGSETVGWGTSVLAHWRPPVARPRCHRRSCSDL